MKATELRGILDNLRAVGGELQHVELKAAVDQLPRSTRETLSAFANSPGGGLLLLGVDDNAEVVGVRDVRKVRDSLADCAATR